MLKTVTTGGGGGSGTVSNVATGTGLTGGPITTTGTISIANTTVTAGTYGNASTVSQVTINAQGQITNAVNVAISIANSSVTGLGTMATQNANAVVITGGSVENTTVGATTPNTGKFTVLTVTTSSALGNATANQLNSTIIGNNSAANGTFTNLTSTISASLANLSSSNVSITGGTINVQTTNHTANVSANATFGTSSLLLIPQGYINFDLNGTVVKVPYYAV